MNDRFETWKSQGPSSHVSKFEPLRLVPCIVVVLVLLQVHVKFWMFNFSVKKGYHKLSLKIHPDRVEDNSKKHATEKFQTMGKVYCILSDKEKRAVYDETGIYICSRDFTRTTCCNILLTLWNDILLLLSYWLSIKVYNAYLFYHTKQILNKRFFYTPTKFLYPLFYHLVILCVCPSEFCHSYLGLTLLMIALWCQLNV